MSGGVAVQIRGLDQLAASLQGLIAAKKAEINLRIQEAGINTHARVVQQWPVGTPESTHKKDYHGGRSRQSFQYKPGDMSCSVGSDVFYSLFIEDGTIHMRARFILTNAFIKERLALRLDVQEMFR